jgi:hypothetical protein
VVGAAAFLHGRSAAAATVVSTIVPRGISQNKKINKQALKSYMAMTGWQNKVSQLENKNDMLTIKQ